MITSSDKIFIAGHQGLLGQELLKTFANKNFKNILYKQRSELDLTQAQQVQDFFKEQQPDIVILAAAKVGGILANETFPAQFIFENNMIQNNVIHYAYLTGVKKLIFYGSSCIYPSDQQSPLSENQLFLGPLEKTNDAYAMAKLNGIKMCQAYNKEYKTQFITLIPCNLYGPHDHFNETNAHVIPSLIKKFCKAKEKENTVTLWGTGEVYREFLHAHDLANATWHILNLKEEQIEDLIKDTNQGVLNVGTGSDITIRELSNIIAELTGYQKEIYWDAHYPNGTLRKVLNVEKIHRLGWKPTITLKEGLKNVIEFYLSK